MTCKFKKKILGCLFFVSFTLTQAPATQLPLPPDNDDLSGTLTSTIFQQGNTLQAIAQEFDVGFFELLEANPKLNPEHPTPGTVLIIPTQHLLPRVPRKGIVINLSTMRLFYFPEGKPYFYTYPIGIGKKDWNSPVGKLKI